MKSSISLILFVVCWLASDLSCADAENEYRDAQRIVVITDDEGIHYAQFCAFYELRDLIAENVGNDEVPAGGTAPALYEVRVLGKFGERVVYVGDHQITTDKNTALVPTDAYARIVKLIEKRRGQGVSAAMIGPSVRRALARIQRPEYIEENRCSAR